MRAHFWKQKKRLKNYVVFQPNSIFRCSSFCSNIFHTLLLRGTPTHDHDHELPFLISDELRSNEQTNINNDLDEGEWNGHSNNESAMTNPPTHTGHLMPSVKFLLFHHVLSVDPLELNGQPDLFFEYLAMMSRGMKFCEISKCRNVLFYLKILPSTHSERWCNG